jgi:hypothetical protein
MKYYIWIFISFLLPLSILSAQENAAETIEFHTINNNENIDWENIEQDQLAKQAPHCTTKKSEQLEMPQATKQYGFYNDIIIGGIMLMIGLIGWKIYQRFYGLKEEAEV